jgi:predicted dehydrogenase
VYFESDDGEIKADGRRYEDLLKRSDIDAVDLVIPIDSMPEFIDKALSAGKHVVSEKPMAPTIEIGKELLAKYRTVHKVAHPGLVWAVAEQLWYEPGWRHIMDHRLAVTDAKSGASAANSADSSSTTHSTSSSKPPLERIGTPLVSTLTRLAAMNSQNKYYSTKWRVIPNYQGGYLFDGGVHEICKLRMVFGEVKEVCSLTHQFKEDLPPSDSMTCSIRFQSGVLCTFTYTFTAQSVPIATATVPHDLMISGTSGSICAKNNEIVVISVDESGEVQRHSTPIDNELGQLSIRRELKSFALAALGKPVEEGLGIYSPERALQDVIILQSLLESSRTGKRIDVETLENLY